jgi:hypothetical protein
MLTRAKLAALGLPCPSAPDWLAAARQPLGEFDLWGPKTCVVIGFSLVFPRSRPHLFFSPLGMRLFTGVSQMPYAASRRNEA